MHIARTICKQLLGTNRKPGTTVYRFTIALQGWQLQVLYSSSNSTLCIPRVMQHCNALIIRKVKQNIVC